MELAEAVMRAGDASEWPAKLPEAKAHLGMLQHRLKDAQEVEMEARHRAKLGRQAPIFVRSSEAIADAQQVAHANEARLRVEMEMVPATFEVDFYSILTDWAAEPMTADVYAGEMTPNEERVFEAGRRLLARTATSR